MRKVLSKNLLRDSTQYCKTIIGIDATDFHPHSLCHVMPAGLYLSWKQNNESDKFMQRQSRTIKFENIVIFYLQKIRPQCEVERVYRRGIEEKITPKTLRACMDTTKLCLKLWDAIIFFVYVRKLFQFLMMKDLTEIY